MWTREREREREGEREREREKGVIKRLIEGHETAHARARKYRYFSTFL